MAKSKSVVQPIIRNRVKYVAAGLRGNGEVNTQPSETIPNQAMSLQEMVNKFTISSVWPKVHPEQFESNNSDQFPDVTKMDKIEIQTLAKTTQENIVKYQNDLQTLQEEEFQKVQEENAALKLAAQQVQNKPQDNPND